MKVICDDTPRKDYGFTVTSSPNIRIAHDSKKNGSGYGYGTGNGQGGHMFPGTGYGGGSGCGDGGVEGKWCSMVDEQNKTRLNGSVVLQ